MESISAAESSTNSESTHTRPRVWSRGDEPLRPPDGKRLLFLDCLDSFSWNIVHAVAGTGCEVLVHHSRDRRACMAEELLQMTQPTHLLLGPGPGRPDNSPLGVRLAEMALAGALLTAAGVPQPLLGICLGHQAIGLAAGWDLVQSPLGAVHGVPEQIKHDQQGLFTKLPTPLPMMRYHSLVLQPSSDDLKVVASDAATESLVMALRHPSLPVYGVQFHPESCGSRDGIQILHNFLEI
jgi:anthranilate synthase/aminodeoxychorismate synthase-like glutamine amidotransferase